MRVLLSSLASFWDLIKTPLLFLTNAKISPLSFIRISIISLLLNFAIIIAGGSLYWLIIFLAENSILSTEGEMPKFTFGRLVHFGGLLKRPV